MNSEPCLLNSTSTLNETNRIIVKDEPEHMIEKVFIISNDYYDKSSKDAAGVLPVETGNEKFANDGIIFRKEQSTERILTIEEIKVENVVSDRAGSEVTDVWTEDMRVKKESTEFVEVFEEKPQMVII